MTKTRRAALVVGLFALATARALPQEGLTLKNVIQTTLEQSAQIALARELVRQAHGALSSAEGVYDLQLGSSVSYSRDVSAIPPSAALPLDAQSLGSGNVDLWAQATLPGGISVRPQSTLVVSKTSYDPDVIDIAGETYAGFGVGIGFSAFKSLNAWPGELQIRAARQLVQQREYELASSSQRAALGSALAYWAYVAAHRKVEVLRATEGSDQALIGDMDRLVEAGQISAADLKLLVAHGAFRTAQRLAAEQALVTTRTNLGLAMGLDADAARILPEPADGLLLATTQPLALQELDAYIRMALANRMDAAALAAGLDAARYNYSLTQANARPDLQVQLSVAYKGFRSGDGLSEYLAAYGDKIYGADVSGGLSLTLLLPNRTNGGLVEQAKSVVATARVNLEELRRSTALAVLRLLDEVRASQAVVGAAVVARDAYRTAVGYQEKKMRAGLSTTLDLSTVQDRLVDAEVSLIDSQEAYFRAVVSLRYELGLMLGRKGEQSVPDAAELSITPKAPTDPRRPE